MASHNFEFNPVPGCDNVNIIYQHQGNLQIANPNQQQPVSEESTLQQIGEPLSQSSIPTTFENTYTTTTTPSYDLQTNSHHPPSPPKGPKIKRKRGQPKYAEDLKTLPPENPDFPEDESDKECEAWWTDQRIFKFLILFGHHKILYDKNTLRSRRKFEKLAARIDICKAMDDELTMEEVLIRIGDFKNRYKNECRRINRKIRNGQNYNTTFKWFSLMDLYCRKTIPRTNPRMKREGHSDSDSDLDESIIFPVDEGVYQVIEDMNDYDREYTAKKAEEINAELDGLKIRKHLRPRHMQDVPKEDDRICNYYNGRPAEKTIKFLRVLQKYPILYNKDHPDWYDLEKTDEALAAVSKKCPILKMGPKQIERKIKQVICNFRIERQKVKKGENTNCKYYYVAEEILGPYVSESVKRGNNVYSWKVKPGSLLRGRAKHKQQRLEQERLTSGDKKNGKENGEDETQAVENGKNSEEKQPPRYSLRGKTSKSKKAKQQKQNSDSSDDSSDSFEDTWQNSSSPPEPPSIERKWTENDTTAFVNCYKENSILWDKNHSEFNDKLKQQTTIKDMAEKLGWPWKKISVKIKILQKAYESERKKMEKAAEIGQQYVCNLKWFATVDSFLCPAAIYYESASNFVDTSIIPPLSVKTEVPDPPSSPLMPPPSPPAKSSDGSDLPSGSDSDEPNIFDNINLKKVKWHLDTTMKFIRLLGCHPCLYDLNDPDYNDELNKKAAYVDIAEAMGHGLDAKFVEKKVNGIKNTYLQERKRIIAAAKKKQNANYKLKWYPLADSFLHHHIGLRIFKDVKANYPKYDKDYLVTTYSKQHPKIVMKIDLTTEPEDQNWW